MDDDADHQDAEPSKRDQRYRQQMRESQDLAAQAVKAAADLAAQLDHVQRAHVESLASQRLSDPAAVWLTGSKPGDFYDAEGNPLADRSPRASTTS